MLVRTFLHFPKIGERREKALWRYGYRCWNDLLSSPAPKHWKHLWDLWQKEAEQSIAALERSDASYFASKLPKPFWWRVVPEFASRAVFLDVETDGTDKITVLGLADLKGYKAFVKGIGDWDEAKELLAQASVVVTYNGSNFDLPVIKANFPDWHLPPLHIDLCPLLRRLGYKGGLKAVEARLGIQRSPETIGLGGLDAIRLWWQWHDYGDEKSLQVLIQYNREDVLNLKPLLSFAYQRLWEMSQAETFTLVSESASETERAMV